MAYREMIVDENGIARFPENVNGNMEEKQYGEMKRVKRDKVKAEQIRRERKLKEAERNSEPSELEKLISQANVKTLNNEELTEKER